MRAPVEIEWLDYIQTNKYIYIHSKEEADEVFDYYSHLGYTHNTVDGRLAVSSFPLLGIDSSPTDIVGFGRRTRTTDNTIEFEDWSAIVNGHICDELDPDALLTLF